MLNNLKVLDPIQVEVTPDEIIKRMRIKKINPDLEEMIRRIVEKTSDIARPKAIYKVAFIESRTDDTVTIDGVILISRVLSKNLQEIHRVFPFVVTAGRELDEVRPGCDRFMEEYVIDVVKECFLSKARDYLLNHIKETYGISKYGYMEPGSLPSWPVDQQKELFAIIGDVGRAIGVTLTESFMMKPIKSVSGILFPTQVDFNSCMLCSRENCPERKAPYNPEMIKEYRL